jgi:hypothetical protein
LLANYFVVTFFRLFGFAFYKLHKTLCAFR